jgi:hypothetical protein
VETHQSRPDETGWQMTPHLIALHRELVSIFVDIKNLHHQINNLVYKAEQLILDKLEEITDNDPTT